MEDILRAMATQNSFTVICERERERYLAMFYMKEYCKTVFVFIADSNGCRRLPILCKDLSV